MPQKSPKVSLITPTYNSAHFLRDTYESVRDQTLSDWEWLVADDGSSDNTEELMQEISKCDQRVKYIKLPARALPAAARNAGLAAAVGEYLAFLDADDLCKPERFERQVEFLDNAPHVSLTYSWLEQFRVTEDSKKEVDLEYFWTRGDYPEDAFMDLAIGRRCAMLATSTVMMRREVYDKLGGFDENPDLRVGDDWEYWLRISRRFKFGRTPGVLVEYRIHSTNISGAFHSDPAKTERALAGIENSLRKWGEFESPEHGATLESEFLYHRATKNLLAGNYPLAKEQFRRANDIKRQPLKRQLLGLMWIAPGGLVAKLYSTLNGLSTKR